MYVKLFLLVSLAAFIQAASRDDPSTLGKCDYMEKHGQASFTFDSIVDKVFYYQYYAPSLGGDCVSAQVKKNGADYEGTFQVGKNSPEVYKFSNLKNGVFDETPVDNTGKATGIKIKIVIFKYDKENGIVYYGRCSDQGTSTTDSRFILDIPTGKNDKKALKKKQDAFSALFNKDAEDNNLRGKLNKAKHPCNN